ncbi:hypothetical protein IHE45_06G058200 [Dioscorea alata]|uniref:Uncharacterized protein n=1 Tax=Dioscorea alata TaxID=55571 RepID=A0ACB7VXT8_DIOAL|nr:hypothetical protein IHE45_06G058200 [Dioscorea alata]
MAEVLSDEDMKDQVVEETMHLAKKDLMQVMKVLARMDMIIFPFCNVIFVRHGHIENFCREKAKHPANYVEEKYGESNLFFTCSNKQKSSNKIWFLDSGCSNNVTGAKELLQNIPGFIKQLVFLGNIKQVQAEGRDTVRSADNTMLVMGGRKW